MINPFEVSIFQNDYSVSKNNFEHSNLILTMFYSRDTIMVQYLVLKKKNKDEYLICSFDFIRECIIPVEIRSIKCVLSDLRDFINSDFNIANIQIDKIDDIIDNFELKKIKKEIVTYENITILATSRRNIIRGYSKIYSDTNIVYPSEVLLISNKNGLNFGRLNFNNIPKDLNNLKCIHLFSDIILSFSIDTTNFQLAATVYNLNKNTSEISLYLSSFVYELNEKITRGFSFQGSDPQSAFHAIIRTSGIKKEQLNIQGFDKQFLPYLVVIPLKYIVLDSSKYGINNVNILSKDELVKTYKGIYDNNIENFLDGFEFFAQTLTEAGNAYDAYQIGKKHIQDVIDIIILFSKNDRILNMYNIGSELNEWSRFRLYKNPECSSLYYVESLITLEYIAGNTENKWKNNFIGIDNQFETNLKELNWVESLLSNNQNEGKLPAYKQLFNALKWLNRSWKTENIEDKIIYTNISMEFLVDKVETPPFIPVEVINEFKKIVKKSLQENDSIFSKENSDKLKNKSLGNLSAPPLKAKIQALIKELGISIGDEEFKRFWEVRNYRNDLVHGRSELDINSDNIIAANLLIGEMISYGFKYLETGG